MIGRKRCRNTMEVPRDAESIMDDDEILSQSIAHPLNVKPAGYIYVLDPSEEVLIRNSGLGKFFSKLSDDHILELFHWLDVQSILNLSSTTKYMRVLGFVDSNWRNICLENWKPESFHFLGTWRNSVLGHSNPLAKISNPIVLSDTIFHPWQYAHAEIKQEWTKRESVNRERDLSVENFVNFYESKRKPVVIENALNWNCITSWKKSENHPGAPNLGPIADSKSLFRVGPVDMRLSDFMDYCNFQAEENPLYLFDCKFVEKVPELASAYAVPEYFANSRENPHRDLFEYMGALRPDYRWIIAGSAKSGSKWHIDPNGTHAWNACISGKKRWIMYPPGNPPPAVTPSCNGMDVRSPLSLMEWYVLYYGSRQHPVEFTQYPGDLVFVPAGWWHCVLNLEPCVAITQNYVADTNLKDALDMFKNRSHLVSGIPDERTPESLYHDFRAALEKSSPALLAQVEKPVESVVEDKSFSFSFSF